MVHSGPHEHAAHAHPHHARVRFVHSRAEFRRLAAHAGLIFSDFSTRASSVWDATHPAGARPASADESNSTTVSFGLAFSHVRSGLPFDFALQPGLVHVNTYRRLSELTAAALPAVAGGAAAAVEEVEAAGSAVAASVLPYERAMQWRDCAEDAARQSWRGGKRAPPASGWAMELGAAWLERVRTSPTTPSVRSPMRQNRLSYEPCTCAATA